MYFIPIIALAALSLGAALPGPIKRATPAVCFMPCNAGVNEMERVGASPAICQDQAYLDDLAACYECAHANGGDMGSWEQLIKCKRSKTSHSVNKEIALIILYLG